MMPATLHKAHEEIRRLRDIICLLEDSRIRSLSIYERPELFADVAEVFEQRNEDENGHLPVFGESEGECLDCDPYYTTKDRKCKSCGEMNTGSDTCSGPCGQCWSCNCDCDGDA